MGGTVNIARDLWDDPTFKDSPVSQREAWIRMISDASWKPRTKRIGDYVVDLQRGQLAASTRFLAKAWNWSEPTVRRFLSELESHGMITRKTDAGVTVITICKYDVFQNKPRDDDADATRPRRAHDANQNKGETREEDSNANASDASAVNPIKAVFDAGVKVLVGCGLTEKSARRFLGKLRKDHPGQDYLILEAIMGCAKAGAVEPIPWIINQLKPEPSTRPFDLSNFGKPIQ